MASRENQHCASCTGTLSFPAGTRLSRPGCTPLLKQSIDVCCSNKSAAASLLLCAHAGADRRTDGHRTVTCRPCCAYYAVDAGIEMELWTAGATWSCRWEPNATTTTSARASTARFTGTTTSSWDTVETAPTHEQLRLQCIGLSVAVGVQNSENQWRPPNWNNTFNSRRFACGSYTLKSVWLSAAIGVQNLENQWHP